MPASANPPLGTELAGYRLEALLGRGGMGVVYRARDLALDRDVALKLLAPHLAEDVSFRERFLTESRVAASLEHPNVVPIHDAGEIEGQLYIVMRLVVGSDLKVVLREGPLEPARAVGIVEQIAGALDAAHARGLVHRDVKPSNVLLDEHGHVYLADFGLSRYLGDAASPLGPGRSLGTADYVAPEQIRCQEVDGRTDVYALGCLLYETLAGQPPFRRGTDAATLYAQLEDPPPTLPGLEQVLPKALAKDPADRYPTCGDFAATPARHSASEPKPARWPLASAAVGIALIAAALTGYYLTRDEPAAARRPGRRHPRPHRPQNEHRRRTDPRRPRRQRHRGRQRLRLGHQLHGRRRLADQPEERSGASNPDPRHPHGRRRRPAARRSSRTGRSTASQLSTGDRRDPVRHDVGTDNSIGSPRVIRAGTDLWFADPTRHVVGRLGEDRQGGDSEQVIPVPPDRTSLTRRLRVDRRILVRPGVPLGCR